MAYVSNDISEILAQLPLSKKSELRISKISSQDGEFKSIDIRQWYCTEKDSTMRPSDRGTRVHKEHISGVMLAFLSVADDATRESLLRSLQ